ncbi:pyridoxamine 5'-phosphate oxidase family protein [Halorussus halophilus]|uniref:pyridoxamine 5'-phosphate oxidase family protein n=1 Tax=Halorussus halophilus TaxID=2650975 RepID=UPI0013010A1B|nr:pyridoxamine 5'-phosphate oxidase family protein [Halorussus halophilus]
MNERIEDPKSDEDADPTIRANPVRSRPVTQSEYGIPEDDSGMLSWEFVAETMADDETFWVTTTRPDGRPHARPVWGVWVDGRFHCGGGERTRWVRNLAENPAITVHRESGTEVVIVEGTAEKLTEESADDARLERIDAAYEAKYDTPHGTPVFAVHPETVLAWTDYPTDATRWEFR